jgi:amino acid transporter, AAT family
VTTDPGDALTITSIEAREAGLHKALTKGQAIMISIGGALGTTIFLSSGIALGYAGPGVMVSYAIAGLIAVVMVFSLSEMAVVHPTAGSFGAYAELYLNPWAGFVVRYTYWFAEMVATGFEAVAAGIYMTWWFPEAPVWMWSLGFAFIVLWVNSRSVGNFGTVEYWFSWIKVSAVVLFIILGLAHIFGLGAPAAGLRNLYALPGGFFPHGFHGVWMAVILGLLSFIGIEVVAVTSGEVAEPEKVIPAALRGMAVRLFLFYVLALGVVAALIPWNQVSASVAVTGSPFVKVLSMSGIPYAAGIMNFVIVSAALSGMNTNVYLCSRMLFSLSRGGYAPKMLGRLTKAGAPLGAVVLTGVCILVAAALSVVTHKAYAILQSIALFGMITVWITILLSHLRFRRVHKAADLPVRMPFFPVLQLIGLGLLVALAITMGLDKDWNLSWMVGVPWLALLTIAYFIWKKAAPEAVKAVTSATASADTSTTAP